MEVLAVLLAVMFKGVGCVFEFRKFVLVMCRTFCVFFFLLYNKINDFPLKFHIRFVCCSS